MSVIIVFRLFVIVLLIMTLADHDHDENEDDDDDNVPSIIASSFDSILQYLVNFNLRFLIFI